MVDKNTFKFLAQISKNNNREWMEANKQSYLSAKENVEQFVAHILTQLSKFNSAFSDIEAKKTMFRINRDVRFSADKSPYKTNFGAAINPEGKKLMLPGFYVHIENNGSFIAGGAYLPMAPELAKIRQEIDYNFDEFKSIINDKKLKKYFTGSLDDSFVLSRPPKGYDNDNPAIDFLKQKSFTLSHYFTNAQMQNKTIVNHIVNSYKAINPFLNFLKRALD